MITDLMETVGSQVGRHVGVGAIFGEPVRIGERTVIPVAKLGFGFGSGGGVPGQREEEGGGGGGGGGTRPLGVFEVSDTGTRFIPIRSKPGPLLALGLGFLLGWSLTRRAF